MSQFAHGLHATRRSRLGNRSSAWYRRAPEWKEPDLDPPGKRGKYKTYSSALVEHLTTSHRLWNTSTPQKMGGETTLEKANWKQML